MRILTIGRTGQVATSLVERAGFAGIDLRAIGRPAVDLGSADQIASVLDDAAPDIVINAAAYTAVDAAETDAGAAAALNAEGPGTLADLVSRRGLELIHLSTDYVFDGAKRAPYTETDPVAPLGVYGRTKLAGERNVRDAHPGAMVIRTAWVYSPFGGNFVKTMLRLAGDRQEVRVVADQQGNPTSALDIADGLLAVCTALMAGHRAGGVYHMTGAGEATWAELAAAVFAASARAGGPSARVVPIPATEYPTPARRPANSRLDCTRLATDFDVRLPDWRDSVDRCVRRLVVER